MRVTIEIDGDTATVEPIGTDQRGLLAARLLEAAGPGNARAVRTESVKGGGRVFRVPTAVVYAAGLVPEESDEQPEPKKAPAKKAAAAKKTTGAESAGADISKETGNAE